MNIYYFVIVAYCSFFLAPWGQSQDSLPNKISLKSRHCSPKVTSYFTKEQLGSAIDLILTEKYGPLSCSCGNGVFQRAFYLNMSNSSMQCPTNWRLYQEGAIRGCRPVRSGSGCSSAAFSSSSPYNRVCGRIIGYQKGTPDAFDQINGATLSIEEHYVDGVSLTYGAPGFRKHIWTFVASGTYTAHDFVSGYNCQCTNSNYNWNHTLPSFIGNNYFCESGNVGPNFHTTRLYADDPLYGQGCASTSTCCEHNRPPWFCASLSQTTTENLEVRICKDESASNEDIILSLIEIYTS